MALYLAKFSDWANGSFAGTANRMSVYGILRLAYPTNTYVPNLCMHLRITTVATAVSLYPANDLNDPIVTITSPYEVGWSSKNSINANDYVLGAAAGAGEVQVFIEVG